MATSAAQATPRQVQKPMQQALQPQSQRQRHQPSLPLRSVLASASLHFSSAAASVMTSGRLRLAYQHACSTQVVLVAESETAGMVYQCAPIGWL